MRQSITHFIECFAFDHILNLLSPHVQSHPLPTHKYCHNHNVHYYYVGIGQDRRIINYAYFHMNQVHDSRESHFDTMCSFQSHSIFIFSNAHCRSCPLSAHYPLYNNHEVQSRMQHSLVKFVNIEPPYSTRLVPQERFEV